MNSFRREDYAGCDRMLFGLNDYVSQNDFIDLRRFCITNDGKCFIHNEFDRMCDVDYEASKEEEKELQKDYIVYVNDGTPAVIQRVELYDNIFVEYFKDAKIVRKRASSLYKNLTVTRYDLTVFVAYCKKAEPDLRYSTIAMYIRMITLDLLSFVSPVDVMAYIIFSLEAVYFNQNFHEDGEYQRIMKIFRNRLNGKISLDSLKTVIAIAMKIYKREWQRK
jgi:hypothetical protein